MKPLNLFSSSEEVSKPSKLKLDQVTSGVEVVAVSSRVGCWKIGDSFKVISVLPRKVLFCNAHAQYSMLPGDFTKEFMIYIGEQH